jgi:integrase
MANVKFYLKDSKRDNTLIVARLHFKYFEVDNTGEKKYKSLNFSTGETINPKHWNTKKGLVKESLTGHPEFNQRLKDIANIIENTLRKMLNDGRGNELNPETLKNEIKEQLFSENKIVKPQHQKTYFCNFIETVINESTNGERTHQKTGKILSKLTVRSYSGTLKHLKEYETNRKIKIRFSDITLKFYNDFKKYLNENNYAINTIGKQVKNIKVFMRIAYERGLTENRDFEKPAFLKVSEETQSIYLTENELQSIYELDLSNVKRLETVRDMFLIACYTGLRFSDLKQLKKIHFKENTIEMTTIKNQQRVIIPLHWTVKEIFNKYEYELPRLISNQKMNEYLKELGQMAGINETVMITETKGGLRFDRQYTKI